MTSRYMRSSSSTFPAKHEPTVRDGQVIFQITYQKDKIATSYAETASLRRAKGIAGEMWPEDREKLRFGCKRNLKLAAGQVIRGPRRSTRRRNHRLATMRRRSNEASTLRSFFERHSTRARSRSACAGIVVLLNAIPEPVNSTMTPRPSMGSVRRRT